MSEEKKSRNLFYFLMAVYGLVSVTSVTAHPQTGPSQSTNNNDGERDSLTVSTDTGDFTGTGPIDFGYDNLLRPRSISSAELIVGDDYGFLFSGDLDPIPSMYWEEIEEDVRSQPNFGSGANFSPTLYFNEPRTFEPPFLAKRAIYFKLPPPEERDKQVLLWLDYNTRDANVKKIVRLNLERQDDGSRAAERLPEGDIEILNTAAIVHRPAINVECTVDFGPAMDSVAFRLGKPFIWPIGIAEKITCVDDSASS